MSLVVKYGGGAMTDPATRAKVLQTIREQAGPGTVPILVHGGGPEIAKRLAAAGITSEFVDGLRVTPPAALVIVEEALSVLGKQLAGEFGNGVALTGRDAHVLSGVVLSPELGRVGRVTGVNTSLLNLLTNAGIMPIVACLASDKQGGLLNINGDEAASAVAGALGRGVLFLTNVPGVLSNPADPQSVITEMHEADVRELIATGVISGGMIPKVRAALDALSRGATFARIADGQSPETAAAAFAGSGTTIFADGV